MIKLVPEGVDPNEMALSGLGILCERKLDALMIAV